MINLLIWAGLVFGLTGSALAIYNLFAARRYEQRQQWRLWQFQTFGTEFPPHVTIEKLRGTGHGRHAHYTLQCDRCGEHMSKTPSKVAKAIFDGFVMRHLECHPPRPTPCVER